MALDQSHSRIMLIFGSWHGETDLKVVRTNEWFQESGHRLFEELMDRGIVLTFPGDPEMMSSYIGGGASLGLAVICPDG